MSPFVIGLIVVAVVLLIVIVWAISASNKLNKAIVKIDESTSDIDVALTKRYDVLVKMIETVKGYVKHEKETLIEVVKYRNDMTIQEKNEANHQMSEGLKKLNILAESYPDLKASENFQTLQKTILDVEEHLQASRRVYNANVSYFNQLIVTFPISIVAGIKHCVKKDFFVAEETKKEDVKIEF